MSSWRAQNLKSGAAPGGGLWLGTTPPHEAGDVKEFGPEAAALDPR